MRQRYSDKVENLRKTILEKIHYKGNFIQKSIHYNQHTKLQRGLRYLSI